MKARFSHLRLASVTAAAAVTLAACAGGVTVSRENVAQGYEPEELYIVGTGENEIKTFIVGDPFGAPKEAFQAAVIASLKGGNFGPRLNLSTAPMHQDIRKRHVVLAFNMTDLSQADDLCSGAAETATVADTGGSLTVTAVYCSTDHYLTQATARSASVSGTDTENFRALMTQLAIALFPDENPHRQLDGPDTLPLPSP